VGSGSGWLEVYSLDTRWAREACRDVRSEGVTSAMARETGRMYPKSDFSSEGLVPTADSGERREWKRTVEVRVG
jgi:hypothetical protein